MGFYWKNRSELLADGSCWLASAEWLLLAIFAVAFLLGGCVYSPEEEVERKPRGRWQLKSHPIKPSWNDRDREVSLVLASLLDEIPARFQLDRLPKVGDQRPQASGTAWAIGYLAASYLQSKKKGYKSYLCSPAWLYNNLNQGVDRGIEIVDGARFLRDHGCADIAVVPYRPQDAAYRSGSRARGNAQKYRISGYGRVDFTDLDQVRAHLLQGQPIIVTMKIADNFIELDEEVWEQPSGNFVGRHSVAVIGYDDAKEIFLIQNSVGEDWGEKGRAWLPYSWFLRLVTQAYIIW